MVKLFNFQTAAGVNILVACTPTRIFSYADGTWTERTPVSAVAEFTKLSGGNGWSVTSGSFSPGQFVSQDGTGATGVYLSSDSTKHYIGVCSGIFNASSIIRVCATSGAGVLTLTGTEPTAVSVTFVALPMVDDTGTGWNNTVGNFTVGDTIEQEETGATGIWYVANGGNYQLIVSSGTFDNSHSIESTASGSAGTLDFQGVYPAETTGDKALALPKVLGLSTDGWGIATGGVLNVGDSVTQSTSSATGTMLHSDQYNYYLQVDSGVFDDLHDIVGTGGTLTLSGTAPKGILNDILRFPKSKWSVTDGSFGPGQTVLQPETGATGIWLPDDGSYYYLHVVTGSFGNREEIVVTSIGGRGTLDYAGTTDAASSGAGTIAFTEQLSVPWFGTEADYIDVAEGIDSNLGRVVVLTNGKNWPIYWDGSSTTAALLKNDAEEFLTAKAVAIFNGYLVFANIQTKTDFEPRTALWSDVGNFSYWTIGQAGILAELAFQGEILRMINYASKLCVFSRNTIGCLCYVDPDVVFGSLIYVQGIKLVGPAAITNVAPFIAFAGQDNFYLWDGGAAVVTFGDRIASIWRESQSATNINKTQAFYDVSRSQMRFIIPTGDTTYRVLMCEMAVENSSTQNASRWFEHAYHDRPMSLGLYSQSTGGELQVNPVLGSTGGKIFIFQGEINDGGNAIQTTWDTCDFVVPQIYQSQMARWLELEFEALGTSVDVEFSVDQGANWSTPQTVTLAASRGKYLCLIDTTTRTLRFRFTSNAVDSGLKLYWYRTWFRAGGAR